MTRLLNKLRLPQSITHSWHPPTPTAIYLHHLQSGIILSTSLQSHWFYWNIQPRYQISHKISTLFSVGLGEQAADLKTLGRCWFQFCSYSPICISTISMPHPQARHPQMGTDIWTKIVSPKVVFQMRDNLHMYLCLGICFYWEEDYWSNWVDLQCAFFSYIVLHSWVIVFVILVSPSFLSVPFVHFSWFDLFQCKTMAHIV
jgi:hypothetical protein